jgi:uncharacterized protein
VRCHDNLARIEVEKNDIDKLFNKVLLEEISGKFKGFGFKYVTLDLEGYRVGSFNETIVGYSPPPPLETKDNLKVTLPPLY